MHRLYFACFILFTFCYSPSIFAQAPQIKYQASYNLTVGVKAPDIVPSRTGGTVPSEVYSKVSTVAGDGFYGYKDTLARFSRFAAPLNSAVDANGNIYVADANLNSIRKISPNGVVTTLAGNPRDTANARNGQDTAARFRYPTGVACDSKGNVYVADRGNNMIRKITPSGLVTTLAGNVNYGFRDGFGTAARFSFPYSIAIDNNDNIIVADSYNNRIRMITPAGDVTTIAGAGGIGNDDGAALTKATFNVPSGVAIGKTGIIYIADMENKCIRALSRGGIVTTLTVPGQYKPISVAVDDLERLYLTTDDDYYIKQFNSNGKPISVSPFSGGSYRAINNSTDTLSSYKGSMGLVYDGKDNLIISEAYGSLVRKVAVHGYAVQPALPRGLILNGAGVITGTPEVVSPVTTYTVTAYNSSGSGQSTFTLGVNIGSQTIVFNKPDSVTYGAADYKLKGTSTNPLIKINYASSNPLVATISGDTVHVIGVGNTVITASQPGNVNFSPAVPVSQTLTVRKAPLVITALGTNKAFGTDNPALFVSYSGFVYGQDTLVLTKRPVIATVVNKTTPDGVYPITVGSADAPNYSITYVSGKLTVFPIPVITAIGSTSILKGSSVTLKVSPSTGYAYQWTFNGIPISGATDTVYKATATGGYNVNITANNFTSYSLYTSVLAQLKLSPDNFKMQINGLSCVGSGNGSIFISAIQKLKYTAVITGNGLNKSVPFTDTLTIRNLTAGSYSVCFNVEGEIFSQCNQVNVTEPKDLSVYSTVNKTLNNITLQLDGGRNFNITLNNLTYQTSQKEITLPLLSGVNKLTVTTDALCQGVVEKTITVNDKLIPYPNPFNNILYVNVGNENVRNVQVKVLGLTDGKANFNTQYTNKSGVLEIDLSSLSNGLYYLNLNLDNRKTGFKIIKK